VQNTVSQSLAGRTAIVNLLPLSPDELANAGIFLDRDQQLVSGFMPYLFQATGRSPSDYYRSYLSAYVEVDVGLAAHLLGIDTPAQMNRDSLMDYLFENMIVMEAVKAHFSEGKSDQMFFFRNSNGLEVDVVFGQQ